MAQLFRVTTLNDSTNSRTFTFILPAAAGTDDPLEIMSRDFAYGGHKWRLCVQKKEKRLTPFLRLIDASAGVRCSLDLTFTLISRDSFTSNVSWSDKRVTFDVDQTVRGASAFVSLDDLCKGRYADCRNEFLFEVALRHAKTNFFATIRLNARPEQHYHKGKENLDYQHYETKPFVFGDLEWVCVFCPNMDAENGLMRHMVQITRKSRLDILCKLSYRVMLGAEGSKVYRSEMRRDIFDFNGNGDGVYFTEDYAQYAQNNQLYLTIELYSISFINRLKLDVLNSNKSVKQPMAQCFDKDRQSWCVKKTVFSSSPQFSDSQDSTSCGVATETEYLTLSLSYPDLANIPRDYVRYVSWSMQILPVASGKNGQPPVNVDNAVVGPFEQFYANFTLDIGFPMRTRLKLQELQSPGNPWLDKVDHKMIIQIEWLCSYLLVHPSYHCNDDVYRKQIMQMRKELASLQTENYSLEKELHLYQMSIADKCESGGTNTPRTCSISSTTGNPLRILNGVGPTAQLHAKATLAAASILATPDGRILNLESPEKLKINYPGDRRLSVENYRNHIDAAKGGGSMSPISPPRSKSGSNIFEYTQNASGNVTLPLPPQMMRNRASSTTVKKRDKEVDADAQPPPPPATAVAVSVTTSPPPPTAAAAANLQPPRERTQRLLPENPATAGFLSVAGDASDFGDPMNRSRSRSFSDLNSSARRRSGPQAPQQPPPLQNYSPKSCDYYDDLDGADARHVVRSRQTARLPMTSSPKDDRRRRQPSPAPAVYFQQQSPPPNKRLPPNPATRDDRYYAGNVEYYR